MDQVLCKISNCKETAILGCSCCTPVYPMCKTHCHLNLPQKDLHRPVKLWKELSSIDSEMLIEICRSRLTDINQCSSQVLTEAQKLIQSIHTNLKNLLSHLQIVKKSLEEVLAFSYTSTHIRNFGVSTPWEILTLKLLENPSYSDPSITIPELPLSPSVLLPLLPSDFHESEEIIRPGEAQFIIMPIPNTNEVLKINPDSADIWKEIIDTTEIFSYAGGWCMLPDNYLFVTGGAYDCTLQISQKSNKARRSYLLTSNTFLINLKTNTLKRLSPGPEIADMGSCTLYDNSIFVFGGYDSQERILEASYKYDIETNTWYNIQSLPQPTGYNSSALYEDRIYIAGNYTLKLLNYHYSTNSYKETIECATGNKFVCEGERCVYLFSNGCIFKINENSSLVATNTSISNQYLLSHSVIRDGSIFFVVGNYSASIGVWIKTLLYRLDTKINELLLVSEDFF